MIKPLGGELRPQLSDNAQLANDLLRVNQGPHGLVCTNDYYNILMRHAGRNTIEKERLVYENMAYTISRVTVDGIEHNFYGLEVSSLQSGMPKLKLGFLMKKVNQTKYSPIPMIELNGTHYIQEAANTGYYDATTLPENVEDLGDGMKANFRETQHNILYRNVDGFSIGPQQYSTIDELVSRYPDEFGLFGTSLLGLFKRDEQFSAMTSESAFFAAVHARIMQQGKRQYLSTDARF